MFWILLGHFHAGFKIFRLFQACGFCVVPEFSFVKFLTGSTCVCTKKQSTRNTKNKTFWIIMCKNSEQKKKTKYLEETCNECKCIHCAWNCICFIYIYIFKFKYWYVYIYIYQKNIYKYINIFLNHIFTAYIFLKNACIYIYFLLNSLNYPYIII